MDWEKRAVSAPDNSKKEKLDYLRQEIANCSGCELSKSRINTVPGEGSPNAEIVFIGEAPGAKEDQTGIPFCGPAGKFLDDMLTMINLRREDVFISSILKCRPPKNRDPEESEKKFCLKFLKKQIEIIDPKLIVCLGRHSLESFLPDSGTISALHGQTVTGEDGRVYLTLYHPAAALHNGGLRQTLIADFKKIPEILKNIN